VKIIKEMKERGHESIIFCQDRESGLKAIIAVHNTVLGPALGGTRMWNYENETLALEDVLRLSKGMTYKSAAAGIGLGGGKAVIIGDPHKAKSESLFRVFGKFINMLNGKYITAEDVGTSVADMLNIRKETKFVAGLPESCGSSGDPSPFTAYGVYCGIKAGAKEVYGKDSLKGKTVAIQGLGNVGYSLAKHLHAEGAKLIVYDIRKDRLKKAGKEFKAKIIREENEIFNAECDIFSPCALGGILNDKTIPGLKCRLIAGAANNQLLFEERHGEMLDKKKIIYITDFVINAGGIINIFAEIEGKYNARKAKADVSKIYQNVERMLALAKKKNITTYSSAVLMAEERLNRRKKS